MVGQLLGPRRVAYKSFHVGLGRQIAVAVIGSRTPPRRSPRQGATANHLTHSNSSSLCAVRWFPAVNSIQTRCRAFQLTPPSSAAVEVRTVAGPSRALQCVLGGRPVQRLVACAVRPCGVAATMTEAPGRPQAPHRGRGCARYGNASAGGRSTSRPRRHQLAQHNYRPKASAPPALAGEDGSATRSPGFAGRARDDFVALRVERPNLHNGP